MPASRSPKSRTEPGSVEPMQCQEVDSLPEGPEWTYEFKLDGYRALGLKSGRCIRLLSRNAEDLSARFPSMAKALTGLPDETVVDGEIVAIDSGGRPSFNDLRNYQTFLRFAILLPIRLTDLSGQGPARSTAEGAACPAHLEGHELSIRSAFRRL